MPRPKPTQPRVRKRKIDLDRVRSRLYRIVLEGSDRDAVAAARALARDAQEQGPQGPSENLLEDLRDALVDKGL